ncbi:hypothetical protein [Prevotella jejuni]|uniref:hypothetical protein n=1 Tax=Prevotella jejuni TaxID=1177574 RepID=UPI0020123CF0|nr:hypothetical protein [Prevotella jejuni]
MAVIIIPPFPILTQLSTTTITPVRAVGDYRTRYPSGPGCATDDFRHHIQPLTENRRYHNRNGHSCRLLCQASAEGEDCHFR